MASTDASADWHLLLIFALVLVVGIAGLLTTGSAQDATGRVIDDACACADGLPVCAVRDGKVFDYASECLAVCDDARVIADGTCSTIRRAAS